MQNKLWVLNLAERLSSNYVQVIIDVWDTKEGQDKFNFMEQMVNNPEIEKVLVICNKLYMEKANQRKGGVGIESQIISPEVYEKADQEKFIPIVREYANNEPCLPTFMKGKFFIDFSNDDTFEDSYETLMRNLFNKPLSKRPPIGPPPSYIVDDYPVYLRTAHKVSAIKNALDQNKPNYQAFIEDYYDSFLLSLKDMEIDMSEIKGKEIDDVVVSQIGKSIHLRNNFIDFVNLMLRYSDNFDLERFHKFWQDIIQYQQSKEGLHGPSNTVNYLKEDLFNFILYELFLYYACLCIKKELYANLGFILSNSFLVQLHQHDNIRALSFTILNNTCNVLNDHRNRRLKLNRANLQADMIKERCDGSVVTFDELKEADILLHYRSVLKWSDSEVYGRYSIWFPHLSVYRVYRVQTIEKMISKRYFEKIKPLFDIDNPDELRKLLSNIPDNQFRPSNVLNYDFPYITSVFDIEKIASIK